MTRSAPPTSLPTSCTRSRALLVAALAASLGACRCGEASAPESSRWLVPENLGGGAIPAPERNPMSEAGVELGRALFFDPRLSGNNEISCAICHDPDRAFTDGRRFSVGASGEPLARNAPTLFNVAWADGLFWDGGAKNLESQVFAPLTSRKEMAQDTGELLLELSSDREYLIKFARAFDDGVTLPNVARAIAQYERSLISAGSRYDRFARGEAGAALDDREQRGLSLFREHCAGCHAPDHFTDYAYHNNGLDPSYPDDHERIAWGRGRITREPADKGKFKTPTLRNVAITAPYMHDGRFDTLAQVLDHYRSGVQRSPTLDPRLLGPDGSPGIPLDDEQASAIIAFLKTLTDRRFLD